jgi:cell division protein FtsI (penicillin-binding protein 3)
MARRRFSLVTLLTLGLFTVIVVRLGYLQIYRHNELASRFERSQSRHVLEQEPRGAILDRTGAVLAMSIEGGACFADPRHIEKPEETAKTLSAILHIPSAGLKTKLSQKRRFVWIARRLDPATAQQIRALKITGIYVATEQKRFYPEDTLAASLLGVVGDEHDGLSGIELSADSWLRGRSTPEFFSEWTFRKHPSQDMSARHDLPTQSVVLTIDRNLQTIAEQELARQLKQSRAKGGTVIMEDPQTGEILAMASAPGFNPNLWGVPGAPADYGPEILKNPAVEKVFEPGSTYKLVTAAAALEERKVTPNDVIFCENGSWKIAGRSIHDHEREGNLTFAEVISHSSNIGTAKVAMRIGQQNLYRYSRAFGFGMPTSCGLPGDGAGILRQPSQWSGASLETISFGQEIGVTALQMVNAYSALANGGILLEPRLFRGIVKDDGEFQEWAMRQQIRRVISAPTAHTLRGVMEQVVESGTGKAARIAGIRVAGKTGTAQKINPVTRQYDEERYLASFCGFAPVENPRIVIGVFLDEPQASIWGGSEAAPMFARLLKNAAPYLKIESSTLGPLAVSRTVSRT